MSATYEVSDKNKLLLIKVSDKSKVIIIKVSDKSKLLLIKLTIKVIAQHKSTHRNQFTNFDVQIDLISTVLGEEYQHLLRAVRTNSELEVVDVLRARVNSVNIRRNLRVYTRG